MFLSYHVETQLPEIICSKTTIWLKQNLPVAQSFTGQKKLWFLDKLKKKNKMKINTQFKTTSSLRLNTTTTAKSASHKITPELNQKQIYQQSRNSKKKLFLTGMMVSK
jgi:hypothetical protein